MRVRLIGLLSALAVTFAPQARGENPDGNWLDSADAVATQELEDLRGRQDLRIDIDDIEVLWQQNKGEQTAGLHGNELNGGVTGNNSIAADAMNGMTGIATVIQNTGNQVIIQDTTMVNITIRP